MLQPQTNGGGPREVPSVTESLDRMVDAAQKVVADEVNLLRVEVFSAATAALLSGVLLLLGTALVTIGWVIVLMTLFEVMAPRLGTLGTLAALAGLNLLPGIVLLVRARGGARELGHG